MQPLFVFYLQEAQPYVQEAMTEEKTALITVKSTICAVVILLVGVAIGALAFKAFFSNPIIGAHTNHTSVIYTDFISILLTSITVLFALVGIFLAILAFIGYSNIERTINLKTYQSTKKLVDSALKVDGEIWTLINKELDDEESEFTSTIISKVHQKYLESISGDGRDDELGAEDA